MTEQEQRAVLERKADELAAAADRLRRYEQAAENACCEVDHEIYCELHGAVWAAEATLRSLRTALEGKPPTELTPQEIREVGRRAQEEAVAEIARAQGWQWDADSRTWQAPDGNRYSAAGDPL